MVAVRLLADKLPSPGLCFLFLTVLGCASPAPLSPSGNLSIISPSDLGKRGSYRWDFEFDSVRDLALKEIENTPLTFTMPLEEDYYAWERALLFIVNHTSGFGWNDTFEDGGAIVTSDAENSGDKFHYQISKSFSPDGYHYAVKCLTHDHQESTETLLNAKNLARFIKDGKLEGDLLRS